MMHMGGWNPNLPGTDEVRRIRGRLSLVLEDTEFGKVYDKGVVLRLLKYLRPHWKMTLFSMVDDARLHRHSDRCTPAGGHGHHPVHKKR